MSGGGSTTQKSKSHTVIGPWQPTQGVLKGITDQASGLLGNTAVTPTENAALGGISGNAAAAQQYAPNLQDFTNLLFQGGGYGTGVPGIQQGFQTLQDTLNPIASMDANPTSNPQTAALLSQLETGVRNSVGDTFAAAGRSFSGQHAKALGSGITAAEAPVLFNQYNTNLANKMAAANSLASGANSTSGALDAAAGNKINAMAKAPGSIDLQNTPEYQALAAEALKRGLPIQNLQQLQSLILPIAQLGQTSDSKSTQTTTQTSDPLQTALGAGLGILGALGTGGAFGAGGLLTGMLGGGASAAGPWLTTVLPGQ